MSVRFDVCLWARSSSSPSNCLVLGYTVQWISGIHRRLKCA